MRARPPVATGPAPAQRRSGSHANLAAVAPPHDPGFQTVISPGSRGYALCPSVQVTVAWGLRTREVCVASALPKVLPPPPLLLLLLLWRVCVPRFRGWRRQRCGLRCPSPPRAAPLRSGAAPLRSGAIASQWRAEPSLSPPSVARGRRRPDYEDHVLDGTTRPAGERLPACSLTPWHPGSSRVLPPVCAARHRRTPRRSVEGQIPLACLPTCPTARTEPPVRRRCTSQTVQPACREAQQSLACVAWS